jgi:hypothetical protein
MSLNQGSTFEDNIQFIDAEIAKRRNLWSLSSVQWMDFDDVAQIIRIHINEKWFLYDPSKPLGPWLNKVISHQIKNIVRNIYGNYSRPCLKCCAAESENLCKIYGSQCSDCPLYLTWEKSKKRAYEVKIPLPIDKFLNDQDICYHDEQDIHVVAEVLHSKMEKILKPVEWSVYKMLFIDNIPEEDVAAKMGYKSNEVNRKPGYKQLRNIRKAIIEKVKKVLRNNEADIL